MRRLLIQLFLMLTFITGTYCAYPEYSQSATPGLYDGTFSGTVVGDLNTNSTLTLSLRQYGSLVNGTAEVGEGLKVDAGICRGEISIPSGIINVSGSTDPANPLHLQARSSIKESILTIDVVVEADLSNDGNIIDIQMKLNMPWPCKSPTLLATLQRYKQ